MCGRGGGHYLCCRSPHILSRRHQRQYSGGKFGGNKLLTTAFESNDISDVYGPPGTTMSEHTLRTIMDVKKKQVPVVPSNGVTLLIGVTLITIMNIMYI